MLVNLTCQLWLYKTFFTWKTGLSGSSYQIGAAKLLLP